MQRKLFSLLLTSALATSVYASEPNVMAIDAKGDSRYSEHDICKTAGITAPEVVISTDGTTLTVTRGEATEATLAVTEGGTEIVFNNYLNGIGDNDSDYQAPASSDGKYLIQNAGNLAYVVTKLGDSTAPAEAAYLQTKNIDASVLKATLAPNTTEFTGSLTQETAGQTISGLKLSGTSANPLSNGTGAVTANLTGATIVLNSADVNVDAAITTSDKKYTFNNTGLIDLVDLTNQTPSDATSVQYATANDLSYNRDAESMKQYISVCLPFDLKAEDIPGEAWTYKGYEFDKSNNICKVKFEKLDTTNGLAANTPVIIKTNKQDEAWKVDISGVKLAALTDKDGAIGTTNGIYGSFNTHDITGKYLKVASTGDCLRLIDPDNGGHNYPFRTCIYVGEQSTTTTTAFIIDLDDESGIDHVDGDVEDAIVDVYTLQGALVAKSVKSSEAASKLDNGVYVTSKGNKLIIK